MLHGPGAGGLSLPHGASASLKIATCNVLQY
jgi:hypothetical protein